MLHALQEVATEETYADTYTRKRKITGAQMSDLLALLPDTIADDATLENLTGGTIIAKAASLVEHLKKVVAV